MQGFIDVRRNADAGHHFFCVRSCDAEIENDTETGNGFKEGCFSDEEGQTETNGEQRKQHQHIIQHF